MKHLRLKESLFYDGSQIEPMWAFKEFKIKDSSIISWIGPMDIKSDSLIDYEDVGLEIKGDGLLHFIIEHFDTQPADIRLCYHRQRLFVMIIKDLLEELGIETRRNGDDLYFRDVNSDELRKISVSIATCSNSSMKFHFALNLVSKGTPDDVDAIGLLECSTLKRKEILSFSDKACETYINEMATIDSDITKTKVF